MTIENSKHHDQKPEVSTASETRKRQISDKPVVIKKHGWAPTIKWIAICLTMFMATLILYQTYRIATAPARRMNAAVETVKDVTSRLDINITKERSFNQLAEDAFTILNNYPVQNPENIGERMFRIRNLRQSNHQICHFKLDFGEGPIPVYTAANNEAYTTAKALGSKEGRLIRAHILTSGEAIGLRTYYDAPSDQWKIRWRRMTINKPLHDTTALKIFRKILAAIPEHCIS